MTHYKEDARREAKRRKPVLPPFTKKKEKEENARVTHVCSICKGMHRSARSYHASVLLEYNRGYYHLLSRYRGGTAIERLIQAEKELKSIDAYWREHDRKMSSYRGYFTDFKLKHPNWPNE